jgi:sterol 24-C-methyltransferase
MAPTTDKTREDGRQEVRIDGYTKFWQKDAKKEAEVDTTIRLDSYSDVVNGMSILLSGNSA